MLFGDNALFLNTSSLKKFFRIFEEKLGKDIPLKFILGYDDMRIYFKYNENSDVHLHFNLEMTVI